MSIEQLSFLDEQGGSSPRQTPAVDPHLAAHLRARLLREALRLAEQDPHLHEAAAPAPDVDEGLLMAQSAKLLGAPSLASAVRLLAAHIASSAPGAGQATGEPTAGKPDRQAPAPEPADGTPTRARRQATTAPGEEPAPRPRRQAAQPAPQGLGPQPGGGPVVDAETLVATTQAWMETLTAELPSPLDIIHQVEALGAAAGALSDAQDERGQAALQQIERLKGSLETIWDVVDGWDGAGFEQIGRLVSLPPKEQEFRGLAASASPPIVRYALALVEHRPGNAGRAEALRKRLGALL